MKKLLIVLVICIGATSLFAQVSDDPNAMFPPVQSVGDIAHFPGDNLLASPAPTLYAMRNANHYYDAYIALIKYHNVAAKDATVLAQVNAVLTQNAKNEKDRILQASTKWFLIGLVASAITVETINLVTR